MQRMRGGTVRHSVRAGEDALRRHRRACRGIGASVLVCAFVGSAAFSIGWHAQRFAGLSANEAGLPGNVMEVSLDCEGWADRNVALGVFVSGSVGDGSSFDEHLVFEEPGTQRVQVAAGVYEVSAQIPQIMLADGTVRIADGPIARRYAHDDGASDALAVSYAPTDMRGMSDDELSEIAAESFKDADEAARVLALAQANRDAAAGMDVATPDIEGDIGDGGGD